MPPGAPYNSFIRPYPIRVDDFTSLPDSHQPKPALHLLTHTHTDHVNGLSSRSFASTVICSRDAKEMLLRHEVYSERALKEMEVRTESVRTFSHLKVDPRRTSDGIIFDAGSRDLLKCLPLNTPTRIQLSNNEEVTITLFDANHCPGAVMYLVEGSKGAVLHTGDFRAEPWFLESLTKNPLIQRYLAAPSSSKGHHDSEINDVSHTLNAIHLDTACMFSTLNLPTKDQATNGLVSLMSKFDEKTYFFINAWTWGYEDILKAVARVFRSKIHVDRYKHNVYSHVFGDPFLRSIITRDAASTRFHACERFDRCEYVDAPREDPSSAKVAPSINASARHVVYVNPVTMGVAGWELYQEETKSKLARGETVNILLVPLSRHSSLPELQAFVSLFKPRQVIPNTLDPALKGLDWRCMRAMFAESVCSSAEPNSSDASRTNVDMSSSAVNELVDTMRNESNDEDVALKNLEGEGALDLAASWTDSGKMKRKLEIMKSYLPDAEKQFVQRVLCEDDDSITESSQEQSRTPEKPAPSFPFSNKPEPKPAKPREPAPPPKRPNYGVATWEQSAIAIARLKASRKRKVYHGSDGDTTDEDDEEERARTMHIILCGSANIPDLPPDKLPFAPLEEPSSPTSPAKNATARLQEPVSPISMKSVNSGRKAHDTGLSKPPQKSILTPAWPHDSQELGQAAGPSRLRGSADQNSPSTSDVKPKALLTPPGSSRKPAKHAPSEREKASCDLKRKRTMTSTSTSATASQHQDQDIPFIDLRNLTRRPAAATPKACAEDTTKAHADNSPPQKRRDVGGPNEKSSLASGSLLTTASTLDSRNQNTSRPIVRNDGQQSVASVTSTQELVSTTDTTTGPLLIKSRKASGRVSFTIDRHAVIERLYKAIPEQAAPSFAARYKLRLAREQSRETMSVESSQSSVPQSQTQSHKSSLYDSTSASGSIPSELPSQDDLSAMEMDRERSRELAEMFRREISAGKRPGLVVPQLECTKSQ